MLMSLVFIAASLQLLGAFAYIRDTLRGKTKPNRISWILWGAAPLVGTLIILIEGTVSWALVPIFMAGFIPCLVLAASYFNKHAYWQLGRFDYACGALGALSLVMWLGASQPVAAVILLATTDGLAALPTLRKAWSQPETETPAVFMAACFGGFAALVNVQSWVALEYAFPLYLFLINLVLLGVIYRQKLFS